MSGLGDVVVRTVLCPYRHYFGGLGVWQTLGGYLELSILCAGNLDLRLFGVEVTLDSLVRCGRREEQSYCKNGSI